jgi:hypothetical protein
MAFIARDSDFYDIPSSSFLGLARDRIDVPHITCLTVNGQDITVGAPVTTGGVQTLTNKTLVDASTHIIDDIDPTRRIQFDASAVTAASDLIIQASGHGTVALPDPGGAALTLIGVGPAPALAGDWTFTNATPSTSTITGTIVNAGGMGVAGAIYVGGVLRVTNATASTSVITGCATFAGGIGCAGETYIGGAIFAGGVLRISDATASVSIATGCATFSGGIGVTGAIYVGSSMNTAGVLRVTDATASTSVVTGCATFAGGIGCAGAIYAGGVLRVSDATASVSSATGCVVLAGGLGLTGAIHTASSLNAGGVLRITDGTASTSVVTGCATFAGGIGCAGAIYADGVLRALDATSSTSVATGCATFAGGIGIAENLYAGGLLRITDTTAATLPGTGCATFGGGISVAENVNALGRVTSVEMQCGTAPVDVNDVVRLTELSAITDSTTLETFWQQSSSPYPANRLYMVFRRMYGIIFATFHQSSTSFTVSAGDPPSLTPNSPVPVNYRPRVTNILQIYATFNGMGSFMVITINADGSMGLVRPGGDFTSGLPMQLTTDNTLSWILP